MKRLVCLAATLGVVIGLFGGGSSALAAKSLAPPSADFGSQQIGTTSAPKAFVLSATCAVPNPIIPTLCFAPEVVSPSPATTGDFAVATNACPPILVGNSVTAPVTCVVTVTFKPAAIGPHVGTFTSGGLTSNLTGTGTPAPVVTPPATTTPPPTTTTPAQKKKKCGKKKGKRKGQNARSSASASKKKGCKRR
jgi:hypothetical protein